MPLKSARRREESHGAHAREDFPSPDHMDWRFNICVRKDREGKMELFSQPVDSP